MKKHHVSIAVSLKTLVGSALALASVYLIANSPDRVVENTSELINMLSSLV